MKTTINIFLILFYVQFSFGQFITTWETTEDQQSITIPINKIPYNNNGDRYVYNYTVDWGDGTTTTNHTDIATHVYSTSGTQTITITGTFPAICFKNTGDKELIKQVQQWGNNQWKSMEKAFNGCINLTIPAQDNPDLSNVTNMSRMFSGAYIFNDDIGGWDVSNVTDMSYLFHFAEHFNQDISGWDVSNVTDMGVMFSSAFAFNQDIGNWNVSKVTSMRNMFAFTKNFNQDLNAWNVSNVTNMSQMFSNALVFNENISNWDVSNVTNMSFMFLNRGAFNQDIGNWNVSSVTNMSYMFSLNSDMTDFFNQDIGEWNVSSVTNMSNMFKNSTAFNQDIGNWNVSNVTNMSNMLNNSGLSKSNYDALLEGWSTQTLQSNVSLGASGLKYCEGESARTTLTSSPNNWVITDDGKGSDCTQTSNYTSIPDANFELYLVQNNIDSDGQVNGEVLTSDIENITNVNIDHKNVADLTGIQNFKALTTLNAYNNQITNVDLSENILLENLSLAKNQLTVLDVSKNVKLKELSLGENQLTSLDVSKNTELTHIAVAINKLTSLDISNNVKLIDLRCEANQISSIDVSMLPDLELFWFFQNSITQINVTNNLKLKNFKANQNQIEVLDLSNNTLLEVVVCYSNNLTTLNIKNGNNTIILDFEAQQNPELKCIKVDDANYSDNNADWTKDSHATFSSVCYEGTVIPDNNFEAYIESKGWGNGIVGDNYVNSNEIKTATVLEIDNKNITDLTGLEGFLSLKTLDARDNSITSIDVSKNINLEVLNVFSNSISVIDVSKNVKLKELHVGTNLLKKIDVSMLPELTSFWCFNNQLSTLDLSKNTNLEVLNCSTNQLEGLNVYSNTLLTSIDAFANKIKHFDIKNNINLTQLSISENELIGLNLKNNNNTKIAFFTSLNNSNLTCIEVDDVTFSNTNWTNKDAQSIYSLDCAPSNDDCSNAIPLTLGQQTPGDVNSGDASNNATCVTGTVLADVWYTVVVPQSGEFGIEGKGFGGALKFAVYNSCSSVAPIACGTSISLKNLTIGTKFYLKVWIESSSKKSTTQSTEEGTFTFTVSESSVLSTKDNFKLLNTLSLYPNPTSLKVNVSINNGLPIQKVDFYNLMGQKVISKQIKNQNSVEINTSSLSRGIYIIKVKSDNKIVSKKLIIQ